MELIISEAGRADLDQLLELYTQLHDNPMPVIDSRIEKIWSNIQKDDNHHIIIGCIDGKIVSSCVLIIIPNLTRSQSPYALIENVITHDNYRQKGYASAVLNHAKELAIKENCYKIMLMTGSKKESTLKFYEKAGYNRRHNSKFANLLL